MQKTSDTYKSIMRGRHWFEIRLQINGVPYLQSDIFSMRISRQLFNGEYPTIGSCVSAEIDLVIKKPTVTIPRNASIIPGYRVTNGTDYSEWIPKGEFWIDTRQETKNSSGIDTLTIHGYDAMLMLSQKTASFDHISVSMFMEKIYSEFGIAYDHNYGDGIANQYLSAVVAHGCKGKTYREILSAFALMLCGNFVIDEIEFTLNGETKKAFGLKLIRFTAIPEEPNSFLIDESGNYILVGGDRIIV